MTITSATHSPPPPSAQNNLYFTEHLGVISALEENFTSADDDFASLQAIHDIYDTLIDTARQKESQAKSVIASLAQTCEKEAQNARYPRPEEGEGSHAATAEELNREISATAGQVASLESQLEALRAQEVSIEDKMKELVAFWNELRGREEVEPRLRKLVALYVEASGVTWDLKTLGGDEVKGHLDVPDAGVLEDFVSDGGWEAVNAIGGRMGEVRR